MAKVDLRRTDATDASRAATWSAAAHGLATILRLLHPLMPFVTEEIWESLGRAEPDATAGESLLMGAAWPSAARRDARAEADFGDLSALVRGIRNLRTEAGTPAGTWVPLVIQPTDDAATAALDASASYIEVLARVRPVQQRTDGGRPTLVAATPLGAAWLSVDVAVDDGLDERHDARIREIEANLERLRTLLANEAFVAKAPVEVVDRERARMADLEEEHRQLTSSRS
jgi:valyl-tRNA synthetase